MPPAPSAAIRLSLLACALTAALTLTACGGDGDATAGSAPAATGTDTAAAAQHATGARPGPCPAKVDSLLAALERLRRQLAVGLSYDQYAAAVKALRADYAAIPVDHLAIGCLRTTGTPAERALNQYIDGANAWGECLADATCGTTTIEPVLQRKWRVASHFLSEAERPTPAPYSSASASRRASGRWRSCSWPWRRGRPRPGSPCGAGQPAEAKERALPA